MPANFPDNPTLNQEFTVDGRTWTWTGTVWNAVLSIAPNAFTASDTAPTSPVNGTGWFDSTSGQFFIYYDQGWVEFGTNLTGPQGPAGPSGADGTDGQDGVASAVAPLSYNPTTKEISINLSSYDTSTQVDTKISTAIANLVDSAPSTLDTLNELAAALSDDASFAATVTNAISEKADSLNPSFTTGSQVTFIPDNSNIMFGDSTGNGDNLISIYSSAPALARNLTIGQTITIPSGLTSNGTPITGAGTYTITNATSYGSSTEYSATGPGFDPNAGFYGGAGNTIDATSLTVTAGSLLTISSSEIGYLDGVTSSIQTQLNAKASITQPLEFKNSSFTLDISHKGKVIFCESQMTVTVPPNIFAAGDRVDFISGTIGVVTFAGQSPLTVASADNKLTINKQFAGATIVFVNNEVGVLIGNLA